MDFRTYLLNKSEALNTIRARENTVLDFENWNTKKVADYQDLMEYINYCKAKGNTTHTIRLKIKSLDHYFEFLIKHKKAPIILQSFSKCKEEQRKYRTPILCSEELQEIYALQPTHGLANKRNKILLSLVVFRCWCMELERIEPKDVDLMNGKIYIPATKPPTQEP